MPRIGRRSGAVFDNTMRTHPYATGNRVANRSRSVLPNTPPRTPSRGTSVAGSVGRYALGQGVRALAGGIPVVGQALAAADFVRGAVSAARRARARPGVGRKRGVATMYSGRYAGPFKRGKRPRRDPYRANGFVHTTEVHGVVKDPDCVYVGHSVFSGEQMLDNICQGLLRKLFRKAGIIVKRIDEPIPGYEANTSDCWKISFIRKNQADGTLDTQTYTFPNGVNKSIQEVVGDTGNGVAAQFPNYRILMKQYAGGSWDNVGVNTFIPWKLILFQQEGNAGTFWQVRSQLDLNDEHVHIFANSHMKIQNRSASATGSEDAQNVSNNPLIGKKYSFNHGSPLVRGDYSYPIGSVMEPEGVIISRASAMTGDGGLKEPPHPSAFTNCARSNKIMMQPGTIRSDRLYYRITGKLMTVLTKLNLREGVKDVSNHSKQVRLLGKSTLVALEDMINVNASNDIVLAYEVNREFGCYFTTKSYNASSGSLYNFEVNLNT